MLSLVLACLFFVGIHVLIAGTEMRGSITAATGEQPYLAMFSFLSLVGLIWMSHAYAHAPYVPLWETFPGFRWYAMFFVLVAFLFAVVGLTTPNPTAVAGGSLLEGKDPARGILRVTRHPFLTGIALWSAVHWIVRGDLASVLFFGSFFALALYGPQSIDRKRSRTYGAQWDRFAAATSIVPFAAIVSGRNRFLINEIGWWRIVLGILAYAIVLRFHGFLFGATALPL